MASHYNYPAGKDVPTFPATRANEITREYYWFLVGEINRGTVLRAVCRIENERFGSTSYHLISER